METEKVPAEAPTERPTEVVVVLEVAVPKISTVETNAIVPSALASVWAFLGFSLRRSGSRLGEGVSGAFSGDTSGGDTQLDTALFDLQVPRRTPFLMLFRAR